MYWSEHIDQYGERNLRTHVGFNMIKESNAKETIPVEFLNNKLRRNFEENKFVTGFFTNHELRHMLHNDLLIHIIQTPNFKIFYNFEEITTPFLNEETTYRFKAVNEYDFQKIKQKKRF